MDQPGVRVAILAADFNKQLVGAMIDAATAELQESGAALARVVRVPGSYEVPLIADVLLASDEIDAVVVLGYIERGETLHGEVMGHVVHAALVQMQLRYRKPVGIGVIGPGATLEQAVTRKEAYARAAVRAMLASVQCLRELLK
jgi:6,7-dimethyl-8-ribityllumazine synthase